MQAAANCRPSPFPIATKATNGFRTLAELCTLWNVLNGVCLTDEGAELDHSFLHFDKGDDVADVWHWFEQQNPLFVAANAGQYISDDHPFRTLGLVEQALAHVASIHPSVTQVIYGDDLRWRYSASEGTPVVFNRTENVSLLEDAADEAFDREMQNVVVTLSKVSSS
ncbi:MAG: hypothetical protein ACNJA3_28080 (plasmid) [Pseudomonas rhizophila]|uniref:hypothetical protein n=1 Tax=Pseudomonas rhizophila TaxID=2045200 RepID=UPI003F6C44A3